MNESTDFGVKKFRRAAILSTLNTVLATALPLLYGELTDPSIACITVVVAAIVFFTMSQDIDVYLSVLGVTWFVAINVSLFIATGGFDNWVESQIPGWPINALVHVILSLVLTSKVITMRIMEEAHGTGGF